MNKERKISTYPVQLRWFCGSCQDQRAIVVAGFFVGETRQEATQEALNKSIEAHLAEKHSN